MSRLVRSNYSTRIQPTTHYQPTETIIYCPVCNMDYPQSQTDNHILRHTIQNVVFASSAKKEEAPFSPPTEEEEPIYIQHPKSNYKSTSSKPLDATKDLTLTQINKKIFLNYSKHEKNKKDAKVVTMKDMSTQTSNKPLLQYKSEETDIYNCFDSVFNGGGFKSSDVGKNN